MTEDECPRCGAILEWDEVDIGVGNPGCPSCHWTPNEVDVHNAAIERWTRQAIKKAEVHMDQTLQFEVIFKRGLTVVATIKGHPVSVTELADGDVTERIIETEQYLERLTGLRVHIQADMQ